MGFDKTGHLENAETGEVGKYLFVRLEIHLPVANVIKLFTAVTYEFSR